MKYFTFHYPTKYTYIITTIMITVFVVLSLNIAVWIKLAAFMLFLCAGSFNLSFFVQKSLWGNVVVMVIVIVALAFYFSYRVVNHPDSIRSLV